MLRYQGPIPDELWEVLEGAYATGGLSVQGDFCRVHSSVVALAASMGWLSTLSPDALSYGKRWRITAPGLEALTHKEHLRDRT